MCDSLLSDGKDLPSRLAATWDVKFGDYRMATKWLNVFWWEHGLFHFFLGYVVMVSLT